MHDRAGRVGGRVWPIDQQLAVARLEEAFRLRVHLAQTGFFVEFSLCLS